MDKVKEKGKGTKYDEEVDNSSESGGEYRDEYMKGVHVDDSKEEMMKGFDEGFDEGCKGCTF